MIYPKVFEQVSNLPQVQAIFGSNPVRIFPFGYAPQDIDKVGVYAVWQTISGTPYNTLTYVPKGDDWSVQIDVYSKTIQQVRSGGAVLIEALQEKNLIQSIRGESRDFETKSFRYSFDVQLLQLR